MLCSRYLGWRWAYRSIWRRGFQIVEKVVSDNYLNIGNLIRSTFDDAVDRFQDETINLLHIDGYHTYEAVSHDYNTWLPKVAKNGIVLFHDIEVRSGDFGVYKFWDEVKRSALIFNLRIHMDWECYFRRVVVISLRKYLKIKKKYKICINKDRAYIILRMCALFLRRK